MQHCRAAGISTHDMAADLMEHKSFLVSRSLFTNLILGCQFLDEQGYAKHLGFLPIRFGTIFILRCMSLTWGTLLRSPMQLAPSQSLSGSIVCKASSLPSSFL